VRGFAEGDIKSTYWLSYPEAEIGKEKIRKLSSICEEKHDLIIQKFVEEATTVRMGRGRN
jgi:hypothetical protein